MIPFSSMHYMLFIFIYISVPLSFCIIILDIIFFVFVSLFRSLFLTILLPLSLPLSPFHIPILYLFYYFLLVLLLFPFLSLFPLLKPILLSIFYPYPIPTTFPIPPYPCCYPNSFYYTHPHSFYFLFPIDISISTLIPNPFIIQTLISFIGPKPTYPYISPKHIYSHIYIYIIYYPYCNLLSHLLSCTILIFIYVIFCPCEICLVSLRFIITCKATLLLFFPSWCL